MWMQNFCPSAYKWNKATSIFSNELIYETANFQNNKLRLLKKYQAALIYFLKGNITFAVTSKTLLIRMLKKSKNNILWRKSIFD